MSGEPRRVAVGRVGRVHGRDGSFYVDDPGHAFEAGTRVQLAGREARVERRGGTSERPLLRVSGVCDREGAAALRGEPLLVALADAPLDEGEWLAEDLVGCRIDGLGTVRRVLAGPSCDLLEVGEEALLVPLVADAVRRIDPAAGVIEVDRAFLDLDGLTSEGEAQDREQARG